MYSNLKHGKVYFIRLKGRDENRQLFNGLRLVVVESTFWGEARKSDKTDQCKKMKKMSGC